MKPPRNVLDHLADCVEASEGDFPGTIERVRAVGAHGASATTGLRIASRDGSLFLVTIAASVTSPA